ncbi:hypothetical protein Bca52824_009798 [Brassica carinata]|uniref:KIB1-4 beta-propeller domain-containing protein n=1 Tax=Brassica carinata TaxID=52824 RepID=A0A8X8B9H1_BRACI|nr:hypothetical protein Bca52824_009798 [Brassica carinata]
MSSLLLSHLSRLCLRKPPALGVRGRYLCGSRFLSQTPIYRIVRADHCRYSSENESVGRLVVRNVNASEEKDEVLEKMVPTDLMNGTIGGSHGWVATMDDYFVCLHDDLNPGASDSDPKRILLRRPKTLPHCQTELVTNVAMSSSPEDEDCILAVKFLGPQLSFCRPARGYVEWVNIRIDDPCFFSSRVSYSERYKMFSMLASGGTYIGYWDLEKKDRSQNLSVCRSDLYTQLNQFVMQHTSNDCRSELLVEGPTGETLIVNWYAGMWRRFMVYKIDEYLGIHTASFTNDIGDVCIFVSSKGQPFCLKASLYGLTSNCIYYVSDRLSGKVSIRDNVIVGRLGRSFAPYFIPPQSS